MVLNYLFSEPLHSINFVRLIYIVVSNYLLFYIIFIININIIPLQKKSSIKYGILIFGTITVAIVLSLSFSKLLFLFASTNQSVIEKTTIINIIKDLVIVVIADITTLFIYITKKEKEAAVEQERFITENIRIRYEVLKNQIDPHFIFNSLNTLDGLIGIDDERAHEYLENISKVFRYVINNKEITHLSDELAFTESFADMMKIRFGVNFRIEYNIKEKYKTWFIMPISLQLLVENAIKHNVVSNKFPLLVIIETTPNDTIKVRNVINLKKEPEKGGGIGLANLTDRYKLLFKKEVLINKTDIFCVEIPLIEQQDSTKI
jgi:LytS/YehU family sensor histidine kinase